ncbi:exodeoxyribonuclease VII large subunit [Algoriphagus kandeliae]|uniref:Exodeoxyribonuclease 7 large subunit n=1 Tax=Algoriphagus kandeliae TaxID=2562278 RepID=A0A4Y9QT31_9BACT|nr:exodeoxyribonuclease VII large subunit [Algoriphagus kandeliae]TFV94326.1 exodeoxyribonuclease VII large subunit [Algoriphagus kandeliae]
MQNALSISELGHLIKSTLENELNPTYWVIGEIADFRVAAQGHAYFELVEKQGSQVLAKMRSNCWQFTYRTIASRFESLTGTGIKNGMKVLAQVQVTFHPVYGFSLNVKDIDASFSLGERARIRQETIDRLTKEGLLRLNTNRPLPTVIQRIGIISSATAAGYGDFVNQLEKNQYGYKIYHRLFPSLMQGNEAVSSLIAAIEKAENFKKALGLEALVIIRGGGAQLDLDCFDDYRLAVKIANCDLPVLTGIGHERDETVADLVAHSKLKTPTAVAEFILSSFRIFEDNILLLANKIDRITNQYLKLAHNQIEGVSHRVQAIMFGQLRLEKEKVEHQKSRLGRASLGQIGHQKDFLANLQKGISSFSSQQIRSENQQLSSLEKMLQQLDPKAILKRGYSRTEIGGKPIQLADPKVGDQITTITSNQRIESTINKIEKEK